MKLHDVLAGIPLEGARLASEMEINSISSDRMALTAVVGGEEGGLTAELLRRLLEGMPRTRVGGVGPETVWINGVELPREEQGAGPLRLQRLLRRMAEVGCTHAVLHLDAEMLARQEFAELRLSVLALVSPVGTREELSSLIRAADTVVLNLDERVWEDYVSIIPEHTFTYSENNGGADLSARNLRLFPGHMEFEALSVGQICRIHLPVPGGFTLYHGLGALACGLCLGLRMGRMARVLRCVRGPKGRLEVVHVSAAYTVVLDRADSPLELERLLTCTREFAARRLLCVLHCPSNGEHGPGLGGVAEQLADVVILSGEDDRAVQAVHAGMTGGQRPCIVEQKRLRAIARALEQAGPGDVIVVSGCTEDEDERAFVHAFVHRRELRRGSKDPVQP